MTNELQMKGKSVDDLSEHQRTSLSSKSNSTSVKQLLIQAMVWTGNNSSKNTTYFSGPLSWQALIDEHH